MAYMSSHDMERHLETMVGKNFLHIESGKKAIADMGFGADGAFNHHLPSAAKVVAHKAPVQDLSGMKQP